MAPETSQMGYWDDITMLVEYYEKEKTDTDTNLKRQQIATTGPNATSKWFYKRRYSSQNGNKTVI